MSHIWQKADGKCHHCKESLPIGEKGTEVVLGVEHDLGYICENCDEINSWQDPNIGKFRSFIFWMGRKYW